VQRRRVLLEDARGADRHLRATWHPEAGQFNVSTWHGDVCAGAVRIGPDEAARLIALLGDGLADAAATAPAPHVEGKASLMARALAVSAAWRARRRAG
jgi:hypothetical protein